MDPIAEFVSIIKAEFPDDRLTYQKTIPTFHPENADEVASLFKLANKQKAEIYITGYGNNIDPIGEPFSTMLSVRTDRLNQLIEVEPDDFYVRAGAGYPLRELNLVLKEKNLWLPQAGLPYVGSVGGAVAVGLSADLHGVDVPLKKYLIQIEVVTPEGEIVTPGSVCFKSVSGYDVAKLYAGSWGLLGFIVSATFRVMPDSGAIDFETMTQKEIDRKPIVAALDESNSDTDAVYSRKIKTKFDPNNIFPVV